MRVDGSIQRDLIPPTRPASLRRDTVKAVDREGEGDHVALSAQEARLSSSATVVAAARVVHDLRDTFQRGTDSSGQESVYTPASGEATTPPVSNAVNSAPTGTAGLEYAAKIADLKTTASAHGLPLISERYADDSVYNGFLEAYNEVGGSGPEGASPTGRGVLDTLG